MAELLNRIKADIKWAMMNKDEGKKNVLRVVVGEVQRKFGAEGDEDVQRVIKKIIEGNSETLKSLPHDGGDPRVAILTKENEILNEYLPQFWNFMQVEAFFLNSNGPEFEQIANAKSDGQATGIAMKALKAAGAPVDGKVVGEVVKKIRSKEE